ncbi:MAG: glutamine synthetase [Clostridiales Family XIII bacterium]|jgi:glutamine synthetase|nr:glutamine synthetase [Clostridiales Family XIII bacterium]
MFDKMLYVIPKDKHTGDAIVKLLDKHPEVQFVSMVGVDLGGHDTDEKIPIELFKKDIEKLLKKGVQTDGSSVVLPKISELNNAKVDIIPDLDVNWYVDYNLDNVISKTGRYVGTLRIPATLVHNDKTEVGSREILKNTVSYFGERVKSLIAEHPYIKPIIGLSEEEEISEIVLTAATELEFWVMTPEEKGDREQLSTSQELKEQYWQRTRGAVRTALEETITLLGKYGFGVEMGHKEVGGVKAQLGDSGHYTHIMEQLEIDWAYDNALQAADNELFVKYVVKDVFRTYGLDVNFLAKPIEGIAGNGEHTHIGAAAKVTGGKLVNLFSSVKPDEEFLSPIGFGAIMGLLKNYEVVNPFVASTIDALNRLKPGFEAPVCIVTSLGHDPASTTRNRTVLAGLVREKDNPLATRFELRAPCPKSNSYLILAAAYLTMLDGIEAVASAEKTPKELEQIISKKAGDEVFYLERDREYRSEKDVFEEYTQEERDAIFSKPPETVWENAGAFGKYPDKFAVLLKGGIFTEKLLESYYTAIVAQWATELQNRVQVDALIRVRGCYPMHEDSDAYDCAKWTEIEKLRNYIAKDRGDSKSVLLRIKESLEAEDYDTASSLQVGLAKCMEKLWDDYVVYSKNII